MSLVLAIDPGLTGAYALLERGGSIVEVGDLPVIADLKTKWIDGSRLLAEIEQLCRAPFSWQVMR